jgi:16S rRNA (uracil1498-N3)-methyltransferase
MVVNIKLQMKQHRFFVDNTSHTPRNFLIKDPLIVRHIRVVLRLKKGDEIILFDGMGMEYSAKIGYIDKTQVAGLILSSWEGAIPEKPQLILAQALPRAGKIEDIVRMNTEIGVVGFILFEAEYSIPKIKDYTSQKIKRLQKISQEALRQSEGIMLPEFRGPLSFKDILNAQADHKLILHAREDKKSVDLKSIEINSKQTVLLAIGPEGGFTPTEIESAYNRGFKIVFLNMPILRTETAGLVASSIILS